MAASPGNELTSRSGVAWSAVARSSPLRGVTLLQPTVFVFFFAENFLVPLSFASLPFRAARAPFSLLDPMPSDSRTATGADKISKIYSGKIFNTLCNRSFKIFSNSFTISSLSYG